MDLNWLHPMRMCSAGVPRTGSRSTALEHTMHTMLRQEIYAKDKWKAVLKLVRVTKRWGGIENVFTMNVHF